jgi:integrase
MAQVEQQSNLDRWDNAAHRLVTMILIGCGLRVTDALSLSYDCLVTDAEGAPYLRYYNHKMKRQALVPIGEELHQEIAAHQAAVTGAAVGGCRSLLFPRPTKNPDQNAPISSNTYRAALYRWLHQCNVRDEHGRAVHLTPHQWRHTLVISPACTVRGTAAREVNGHVPDEYSNLCRCRELRSAGDGFDEFSVPGRARRITHGRLRVMGGARR